MPELPDNILTALTNVSHSPRLAKAYLQPLDMAPDERPPWNLSGGQGGDAIAFQYWPETIQDTRGSEWSAKTIPGGSHPIYQWTHGTERQITFTAMFTTDTAPEERLLSSGDEGNSRPGSILSSEGGLGGFSDPYTVQRDYRLSGLNPGGRDVDLRSVVSWLRWYTYPYYTDGDGWKAYEPPKCLLVMPNMGMGYLGYDHVTCVLTQCDVTYEACFETGFPRLIEVSLSFNEVVQEGTSVQFHNRRLMGSASARNVSNYLALKSNER